MDGKVLRVLVADGSEDDVGLLLRELRRNGYEPLHQRVDSRASMRKSLKAREWDIVLSDSAEPALSCPAALKVLKDSGLDIPFIIVSGHLDEEGAVQIMRTGAHDYIPKGNLARLVPAIERELRESEARRERRQTEEKLRRVNNELETFVRERTAQLDAANETLRNEIAERKRAEDALEKLNLGHERTADLVETIGKLKLEIAELKRAMETHSEEVHILIQQGRQRAMGEILGNFSHQWRQPLNVLGLTIQQLLLVYDHGELSREFLDQSVTQSMDLIQKMSRTIDDFRNCFRPDKEKVEFKLSETIINTLSFIESSFKNLQIGIEVVAKDDFVIFGYRNEFAQVLLNILNHARDALKERGAEKPRVTITICSEAGCAVVTVADNAGGIPDDIMESIFDPYFAGKGQLGEPGVGLFMSKAIIEKKMGGRLAVRNTGTGVEFRIEV